MDSEQSNTTADTVKGSSIEYSNDSSQTSSSVEKKRRHYHNHSENISQWMTGEIEKLLKAKGHEVVVLNVSAEIFVRMEKMQIINTLTCKYKHKGLEQSNGKLCCLEGYSSTNKTYENAETKWLVNGIKELECKALLKFGGHALNTIEKSYSDPVLPEHISSKHISNKTILNDAFFVSESVRHVVEFLTEEKFIRMWVLDGSYTDGKVSFDNVVIKNIHRSNAKCEAVKCDQQPKKCDPSCGDSSVLMEFKWSDWEEFSSVELKFTEAGENTKVSLCQRNVPLEVMENVRAQWHARVFMTMGRLFNFTLKRE